MMEPAAFDYARLAHPPVTFRHEKLKYEDRIPAARRYIVEHGLNELLPGRHDDLGLIVQGGLTNTLVRALQQFGLADAFGELDIPTLVLNVTSPLVPDQIANFCMGKRAVLVLEEGQPEYIEQEIATLLRRRDIQTPLHGKDLLPMGGEYTVEVIAAGLAAWLNQVLPPSTPHRCRPGWTATAHAAPRWRKACPRRCPPARRVFASAVRSARCSRPSSWRRKRSAHCMWRPTSAATPSPPSSRFPPATPSSAMA
jgi:indolepyruvate ferredoxin oxidoreductase alpha subunit